MAEEFLTLMADFDNDTQQRMSGWYNALKEAGFTGTQTPGLPFHISMVRFPLDKELEAIALMRKAASEFSWVPVHISHIGMFAGGKVLFGAPEMNTKLAALHDALEMDPNHKNPWTPHVTVLIDEPETVYAALSVFVESFIHSSEKSLDCTYVLSGQSERLQLLN